MFNRSFHNWVALFLRHADIELLEQSGCYFAGGTAIALTRGEHRLSKNIEFLCVEGDGYNQLAECFSASKGFSGMFPGISATGTFRSDLWGFRQEFAFGNELVSVSVQKSPLATLRGERDAALNIPVLGPAHQFASKVLENLEDMQSVRASYRHMLDIAALLHTVGPMPELSWGWATEIAGKGVLTAIEKGRSHMNDPAAREEVFDHFQVNGLWRDRISKELQLDPVAERTPALC